MQINLSSRPRLLAGPDLAARFLTAMTAASSLTGVRLFDGLAKDADHPTLEMYLDNIFRLTQKKREIARETAAAALLNMAIDRCVMLPAGGRWVRELAPANYAFKLPAFFSAVDACVREEKPRWFARGTHFWLLLMTDCRKAEDFDVQVFAELHSWLINEGLVEPNLSLVAAPYVLLRGLEQVEGSPLSRELRHGYILWRALELDKKMNFDQFMSDPENLAGMRVHGHKRERIELANHVERRQERERNRKDAEMAGLPPRPFVQSLLKIAEGDADDAPEKYFEALTGGSNVKGFRPEYWLDRPIDYPGRESVDVAKLGTQWFVAFRAFLVHRQKDYESYKQVQSSLHVLADYILLYLPWWMVKHPDTTLVMPTSPKQFLRYYYVDRTRFHSEEEQGLGALPKTLNELLPLRRPTPDSRNTTRILLQMFFSFVLTYFEDNTDFIAKGMQNPIRSDFDNEVSGRKTKTNKVPFAEDVFPFLVHYGQAVEAFGEFLQQQAYVSNAFSQLPNGPSEGYDTGAWGFVPVFWYRSRMYRLDWLPNLFLTAKRAIQSNPPGPNGIYVQGNRINSGKNRNLTLNFPHLTVIRLLMTMVESGLRGQSVQWLDRRTFDKLASALPNLSALHGNAIDQSYHALYLNTDKAHEPWNNLVSWRVRRSLVAECFFQESNVDSFVNIEAPYEDREYSRFLPVISLFRSPRSEKPISDSHYSARWVTFLFGFQSFYNSRDGVDRSSDADALVVLKEREDWAEGDRMSKRYLAIHTPHSCRATYATLKDGDLEVSEIAEQLGHSNTVVTNHYQVPQLKRLVAKLKRIDERLMGSDDYDTNGDAPGYLHPEKTDSSVRIAFDKSRDQAISDYGFVPGVALWSLSELDGDASTLELLRQSPASIIRWHSTHVCPVGNQCPAEVISNIGAMNRCGCCPLAAKCIDHLPAIDAKQSELHERIKTAGTRQRLMAERGVPQPAIDALHKEMLMDTKELLGWKLSAEILRNRQREMGASNAGYHVDQPELVRKQLELVTRNRSESEFFLRRISDANAYPSLESAEVRAKAARYTRLILAQQGRLEDAAFLDIPAHSELIVFASMLKPYVEAKNLTLEQLASAIDELPRLVALAASSSTPLLPGA